MISYAQNFEDVLLYRVFGDRADGFYIDAGAMDPVTDSVTKWFYDQGWSGINIEPNEWFYKKLLQDRPRDVNLNLALGDHEGVQPFYLFDQLGVSTFVESNRDHYVEEGLETHQKTAQITTLAAVCRDYVRGPIDFLKIDCEGWEEFVIKGADWDCFRPIMLIIEATAPGTSTPAWSDWEPYLTEQARYDMVYFDGLNRFYVRRESADLRCHFAVPPNVFDNFKLRALVEAEQARDSCWQERSNLVQRVADLEQTRGKLEQELLKTRLWVGRLSQDLAASRRKQ